MAARIPAKGDNLRHQALALEKAIRRIVRANDVQSRAVAKQCGLTSAQLVICRGIHELGEVTTTALSAYADLSAATVVTVLDNLEMRGLIERYRSLADRRIVHTRLTETGRAIMAKAPRPLGEAALKRLKALDADARRGLVASAAHLADLLERDVPEQAARPAGQPLAPARSAR